MCDTLINKNRTHASLIFYLYMQIIYKMQIVLIVVFTVIILAFFNGLLPPSNPKMIIAFSMNRNFLSPYYKILLHDLICQASFPSC